MRRRRKIRIIASGGAAEGDKSRRIRETKTLSVGKEEYAGVCR